MRTRPVAAMATVVWMCALVASSCSTVRSSAAAEPAATVADAEGGADPVAGPDDQASFDSSAIDTVVMIGDSITVASTPALTDAFGELGFEHVVIESRQGKRIAVNSSDNPGGVGVAESIRAGSLVPPEAAESALDDDHSNELWVIALGTNDINQYSNPAARVAAVNEMLALVPDESPLIWVDTFFRDEPQGSAELNSMIEARVTRRGNSAIAQWSAVAGDEGNLRDDGVHPREQGTIVFAATVSDAIVALLQR